MMTYFSNMLFRPLLFHISSSTSFLHNYSLYLSFLNLVHVMFSRVTILSGLFHFIDPKPNGMELSYVDQ